MGIGDFLNQSIPLSWLLTSVVVTSVFTYAISKLSHQQPETKKVTEGEKTEKPEKITPNALKKEEDAEDEEEDEVQVANGALDVFSKNDGIPRLESTPSCISHSQQKNHIGQITLPFVLSIIVSNFLRSRKLTGIPGGGSLCENENLFLNSCVVLSAIPYRSIQDGAGREHGARNGERHVNCTRPDLSQLNPNVFDVYTSYFSSHRLCVYLLSLCIHTCVSSHMYSYIHSHVYKSFHTFTSHTTTQGK